jgi:hypothetical protein
MGIFIDLLIVSSISAIHVSRQYKDHAKKIYEIQYVSGKNLKMNQ